MLTTPLWPAADFPLSPAEHAELLRLLQPAFAGQLTLNQLPVRLSADLAGLYLPLAAWLNRRRSLAAPLLVGVNGSQGSGKTSLCNLLKWILEAAFDCRTLVVSIDDLYLPKSTRQTLAARIHPLLATRGVPGTHDIPLGLELLAKLRRLASGETIEIPRFNKATDDRFPEQEWEPLQGPLDLILFEGWCVGATPQTEAMLVKAINRLEEREDPDGRWRRYVNDQLRGAYRQLFEQLDLLLMLRIPDWELVYDWRKRQEQQLAARRSGAGVMGEVALRRFIQHYERLTRHQLAVLPETADLVLELNREQRVTGIAMP